MSGRLAAVASRSNGVWQVDLFSYNSEGELTNRYTYTQGSDGSVLTALNTTLDYRRDLRGELTRRKVTVGSSNFYQWYDYNGRGLLWKVTARTSSSKPSTPDVTYTYRPSGQLASRQYKGGPLVPMRYTIREQLERIGDPATTSYPFSARYSYHPNGLVQEAEFYSAGSPATQKRYGYVFSASSYDALNRLKSADFSNWTGSGWNTTAAHDLTGITYDAAGNLKTLSRYRETGTLIDNLTYNYPGGSNRLGSTADAVSGNPETWDAKSGSFTYDANGNLKTAPAPYSITAATYDVRNLPLSFTAGGVATQYRYNAGGQRITKRVGGGNTEVYVLDGPATIAVYSVNGAGTPVSWNFNLLAGDRVIGRQPSSGNPVYYHKDLLGSTRAVVQGTTVVESYDYDPWGLLMPGRSLAGATKERFTGKERDAETGLDYFGFRYYMPALGRWTTVDPPADSFPSWNPYNYVENNPVTYTDPFGLWPVPVAIGVARLAALVGPRATSFVLGRALPAAGAAGRFAIEALKPGAEPGVDAVAGAAARGAGQLDDAALVVRGGQNTAAQIVAGAERVDAAGLVHGVSVNSAPGASLFQLSSTIPHNQVGVTTAGQIRAAGGTIVPDPTPRNPYHCLVSCMQPQTLSDLLTPTVRRPR